MKFNDPNRPPPRLYWKNNVRVPMPWPGTWLTAWRNEKSDGVCGVALSGKSESIDAFWRKIQRFAPELERQLPDGSRIEAGRFGIGIIQPNTLFRDDDEKREWLVSNLDKFATVLQPRMELLLPKEN